MRNNDDERGYVWEKEKDEKKGNGKQKVILTLYKDHLRLLARDAPLTNLQQGGWEDDQAVTRKKWEREWHDKIWEINDKTRLLRQTDHIQNNINSDQLTLFWTETEEGSQSNKARTTSTWPFITAMWMGRWPCCYKEETRKRVKWSDMSNKKRDNKTVKTFKTISSQLTASLPETVEGSLSNKTRTTSMWPFHTARWMGRSPFCYEEETRKRVIWWDMRSNRIGNPKNTISTQINLHCCEQTQMKDHTSTRHEPLPRDRSMQQGGWGGSHTVARNKRER